MATEKTAVREQETKSKENDGLEIDLIELLYRLLEKARFLILFALIGALLAGAYTYFLVKPSYKATSKLYVRNTDSLISLSELQVSSNLAQDYIEAFGTYGVYEYAVKILRGERLDVDGNFDPLIGLPASTFVYEKAANYSYSKLHEMISVSNTSGTRILAITATSTDPEEAVKVADAYGLAARIFIREVMLGNKSDSTPPSKFELAAERGAPTTPSSPNKARNIVMGFVLGLVLAALIIIIQFIVDDRVRNSEILEKRLGLPVLGMMPDAESSASAHTSSHASHHSSDHTSGRHTGGSSREGGEVK